MLIAEIIYSTVHNKCPRCHKGQVFEHNTAYPLKKAFTMRRTCSVCQLKYERETGFFYGAMYVSYGLMSGLLITWFIADLLFFHLPAITLALMVTANILIFFPLAYRWARLLWLNFFVRYDKTWQHTSEHLDVLKNKQVDLTILKPKPNDF